MTEPIEGVVLNVLPNPERPYCSLSRPNCTSVQTAAQGGSFINQILLQDILCWHDVYNINQVHHSIDLFSISGSDHSGPLLDIIIRVKSLQQKVFEGKIKSQDIISLYYLQNFLTQNLHLAHIFKQLPRPDKFSNEMREIAADIPCCGTRDHFDEDIRGLIGEDLDEEAQRLIHEKKDAAKPEQERLGKILRVQSCKNELVARRARGETYPDYYDELVDNGYTYLYQHLSAMSTFLSQSDRKTVIDAISFSKLSHVIVEAYEAITQKVINSLTAPINKVIFLLGGTGAGKSTTLCFLRGDEMELTTDSGYKSNSDTKKIIGHAHSSCTFLPSVETVYNSASKQNIAFVDFPGFNDTNGQLISIGIELALKALVKRYHPQILILEAITNIEGRFDAAAKLASRLERLLGNREKCILGITKYSRDVDFAAFKTIEKQQKQELLTSTPDELLLEKEISKLSRKLEKAQDERKRDKFTQKMGKKQRKLDAIRQSKLLNQEQPLPDTEEKQNCQQRIRAREQELLRQTGLSRVIRFSNLELPSHLTSCMKQLSEHSEKIGHINSELRLDADDRRLIDDRFENNLMIKLENEKNDFNDISSFEKSFFQTSLTATVTASEIGKFLHLPEMDPSIVKECDKKIVTTCIDSYMRVIFCNPNTNYIRQLVQKLEQSKKGVRDAEIDKLIKKWNKLEDYIRSLLGIPKSEDGVQASREWNLIENKYKTRDNVQPPILPRWAKVLMGLPFGIPYLAYTKYQEYVAGLENEQIRKENAQSITKLVSDSSEKIDQIQRTLLGLKQIKNLLLQQDGIHNIINSSQITLSSHHDFIQSVQELINRVRSFYGEKDWDVRVSFLKKKCKSVPKINNEILCFIIGYIISPIFNLVATMNRIERIDTDECLVNHDYYSLFETKEFLAFLNELLIPLNKPLLRLELAASMLLMAKKIEKKRG